MFPALILAATLYGSGWPGPESRADYVIHARLLPDSTMVRGSVEITFVPAFPADTLWLHLYPNAYRDPSTVFAADEAAWGNYGFARAGDDEHGWIALDGWTLDGRSIEPVVEETLAFVALDSTAMPGDTLVLAGMFDVRVPVIWSRMGHDGDHYEMSQWYPKMCVLDEEGWHLGRYHSEGEFYSDYGSYEVTIRVPEGFVTAATGDADSAWCSEDSTSRFERWSASNVHDFAWAADPEFVLSEHNFIYPESLGGTAVRVHLAVREQDLDDWSDVGTWADSTLLYYGEWFGPYPFGDLWIVQSASWGGMEYPQLVLVGRFDPPFYRYFEMVVMHEVGHQWFYGMLGNDEVDEAWLDEGMNSYAEMRYFERKYGIRGNMTSLPGWISDASDADGASASYTGMVASGEEVAVISTSTEAAGGRYDYGALYYSKPALFMRMLENQMGTALFDSVMHEYARRFAFHHPETDDFLAVAEEVTGRSWQAEFTTWLRSTASADVRVEDISRSGDSTLVTLQADIPLPVVLDLEVSRPGESRRERVPVEPGERTVIAVPGRWWRATADPETRYLDRAPWNNSLPPSGTVRPLLYPYDQPSRFNTWILPVPGWADGSWEAGLYGLSRSASLRSGGPLQLSGLWRQPLDGGRPGVFGLELQVALSRARRASEYLSWRTWMGYGREHSTLTLSRSLSGALPSDPAISMWVSGSLESVSDTAILGGGRFSPGRGALISAGTSRWSSGILGSAFLSLRASLCPGWEGEEWASFELQGSFASSALPGSPETRLFVGRSWGGTPLQHLFRPGGGVDVEGLPGWLLPPDGPLSPSERYFAESGPAMPGYGTHPDRGRVGIGLGGKLHLPSVPVSLFADAGWVADSESELSGDSLLADAGVALDLGLVRAWFPAWVSDPLPGDDEWGFRWRMALSVWMLPVQLF